VPTPSPVFAQPPAVDGKENAAAEDAVAAAAPPAAGAVEEEAVVDKEQLKALRKEEQALVSAHSGCVACGCSPAPSARGSGCAAGCCRRGGGGIDIS
jgi:hypothetical protein